MTYLNNEGGGGGTLKIMGKNPTSLGFKKNIYISKMLQLKDILVSNRHIRVQ